LTTWNSAALIIVATYIFILNDQAYRDSLTGLENRLSYEHYAQNVDTKKLDKLRIIYIDLDNFKTVNDQYGHNEGDKAIKTFARLLVDSFPIRENRLIRFGGDEFLVLFEGRRQEKLEDYIENLIQQVELYNRKGEKPYKIKFSYGGANYTKSFETIRQLLEHADQLMYQQKQMRNA
jgi:diguanylate cyclase (GGDEF)-like protein